MGQSRWSTPLQLWAEKTGKVEEDDFETEFQEMGKELEETVARLFTKRTGKKVRRAPKQYIHPDYKFIQCQVDRLVVGTDELVECKTCSAWKEKEWDDDEIPAEYILQVMWQLGITGRKIGHIAVLIGGNKFLHKEILFDEDLWKDMVSKAVIFWDMVKKDQEPYAMSDDNKFIGVLHPDSNDDFVEVASPEWLEATLEKRKSYKQMISDTEKDLDELEAILKQKIGDRAGLRSAKHQVTWKPQTTRRVNTQAIKDAGLFGKYSKTTVSKVLRQKALK
jgi:putative phage-type endonuclease